MQKNKLEKKTNRSAEEQNSFDRALIAFMVAVVLVGVIGMCALVYFIQFTR